MNLNKPVSVTKTLAIGLLSMTVLSMPALGQQTTITYLIPAGDANVRIAEELATSFEAANPDINIEIEVRPGGSEGDNFVKTRLATGTMADVFRYNSGSLFSSLNPEQTLLDLSNEPWMQNVAQGFKDVVTADDGTVRAAPYGASMAGGIYYNRNVYEQLGLEVPTTWDEFTANNDKVKAASLIPVVQTYKTAWTSQIIVLADFYNVLAANPDFPAQYTANEAKFATTPAALASFEKLGSLQAGGYLNEGFGSTTYEDGLRLLAEGKAAHFPMLTSATNALRNNFPEALEDIGFFAIPGDSAEKNGLTVWLPDGIYIPQSAPNPDASKKFVAFIASPDGCDAISRAGGANGPYLVDGCVLPDDVPPAVSDMLPYFEEEGRTAPALEFLSPIKGPALEQITVEVGSGIRPAADGAALYDEDVRKQAQQLGLAGW